MKRSFVLAFALGLAICVVNVRAEEKEKDKKEITIKDVMKAHAKDKGHLAKSRAAVKGKKWEDAAEVAKEWVVLAEALAKAEPPKGEAESWKKLAGSYEKAVKTFAEAAKAEDAKKANGALGYLGGSCAACHKAHK